MKRNERKRGAVLGMVLVMLLVVSLLGAGLLQTAERDAVETSGLHSRMQAFWLAEAGMARIRAIANKRREPFDTIGYFGPGALAGTVGTGTYRVDVLNEPGWPALSPVRRYVITSRGTSTGGAAASVELRAQIDTFASYMHASHLEETAAGDNIYFTTGDVLDGMLYVNDQINVWERPRFLQMVRSGANSVNYRAGGDVTVFEGGLGLNAPPLDFHQYGDHVATLRGVAQQGGLALTGDYTISFLSNGKVTYQRSGSRTIVTNSLSALNGVISVDGRIHVAPPPGKNASVVNGNVTVAASRAIYLDGNVVYDSASGLNVFASGFDPRGRLDDSLGLVSSEGAWVTGDSAITIHAAILVTAGDIGFSASYADQEIGTPQIKLFGSIAQYRRGVIGKTGDKGFRKKYRYDMRFLLDPPVHFPYSAYVFTGWRQSS